MTIKISIGLIEKLAGIKQEKPSKQQQHQQQQRSRPGPPGLGVGPGLPPPLPLIPGDLSAALGGSDPGLQRQLVASRRLGRLLLKGEEAEAEAVGRLAQELVEREYIAPARPVACQAERDACVRCYQQQGQSDVLACSSLVDAYSACADKVLADKVLGGGKAAKS